jgi:hypothetical protein
LEKKIRSCTDFKGKSSTIMQINHYLAQRAMKNKIKYNYGSSLGILLPASKEVLLTLSTNFARVPVPGALNWRLVFNGEVSHGPWLPGFLIGEK